MKLKPEHIERTCPEVEIFESILDESHQEILELGCGDATLTRLIAEGGENRSVIACEVDEIQHHKNLEIDDLVNVRFMMAGSEDIPLEDNSIDMVFMFKSLHHVPLEYTDQALAEVGRVLRPGGLAYISEPIFDGDFNDVLRIFHDEERVRYHAFQSVKNAIENNVLTLQQELFFNTPIVFDTFELFKNKVVGVTHSNHQLSDEMLDKVEWKFDQYVAENAGQFIIPIRVDLLKKPLLN